MAGVRQAFEQMVAEWPEITSKLLFGVLAYQARGTTFAALITGSMALTRLNEEQREALEAQYPVRPFRAGKKTIKQWATLPITDSLELEEYLPFIEQSYRNALEQE
jgi:hypothetical protein